MANLVNYVKTVWENGKTALNAARMNNMEKGISDCATQINRLGDSVSRCKVTDGTTFATSANENWFAFYVKCDNDQEAFSIDFSNGNLRVMKGSTVLKTL